MDGRLQLKLSLLRGESPSPMDVADFGRPSAIQLRTQVKSALSDRIAVAMLDMIASGRLPPGSTLPPERRMAAALSASRVCVRSALDRLKVGGYVEAIQGSGTRVIESERSECVAQLIRANRENLHDLHAFVDFLDHCVVECLIDSASPMGRDAAVGALAAANEVMAPRDRAEQEAQLRVVLADASGNRIFSLISGQLVRGMRSLFASRLRTTDEAALAQLGRHGADLAAAIARRDLDGALVALARRGDALWLAADRADQARPDGPADEATILRGLMVASPEMLTTRLTREITRMIVTGSAREGPRLLSERRFAALFGVSRASVREALATLKADGVIVADERSGTRICDARAELASLAATDLDHLKTMARLRGYLEVWAARRAAVRGSEDDVADLKRILNEMRRSHLDARRRLDLDLRLHLTIARAAGSAVHLYITEVLRELTLAYFEYSLGEPSIGAGCDEMLLRHHTAIVAAIAGRDADGAARAMLEHCGAFSLRYRIGSPDQDMVLAPARAG